MEEKVILVDENDQPIGLIEKLEAHKKGLLHRAFSVFVVNEKGELLLQQRALDKYHSAGLWTNTCCSHQRENETTLEAANRRLMEEMGMQVELKELFSFIYKADFENGLTEHELDYVLVGFSNENPHINPQEVADFQWKTFSEIQDEMQEMPEKYTIWFRIIFEKFYQFMNENKSL